MDDNSSDMMLQPTLMTFPTAMTLTAATAPVSSCQPLVIPQLLTEGSTGAMPTAGLYALAASTPQPCTVSTAPPVVTSSLLSVFAPGVSKLSAVSGGGEVTPEISPTTSRGTKADAAVDNPMKQDLSKKSDIQTGLDLGNGWKVVGLTPLIEPGSQKSNKPSMPSGAVVSTPTMVTNTSASVSGTPSSTDHDQWKIVGLIPLNPAADVGATGDSSSAHQVGHVEPSALPHAPGETAIPQDIRKLAQPALQTADLQPGESALKTCDWKIAGITMLPIPPIPAVNLPAVKPVETAESRTDQKCSVSLSAPSDDPKWRVVGVTSLPSGLEDKVSSQAAQVPPVALPAAPPVSAAAATNLAPLLGDAGWKVVGVVPLPQGGDISVCKNAPCHDQCQETCTKPSDSSTPAPKTSPKVAQPSKIQKIKDNKKQHPLSFLPNCSKQFRNAILKKNTVSTMLELKRAYQQKLRREGKLLVPAPSGLNIPLNHPKLVTRSRSERETACESALETDSKTLETDDKVVLSELYNSQVASRVKEEPDGVSELDRRKDQVSAETGSLLDTWHIYKAERSDELVMSDSGNSSDGVNLTAVDPWGVCTDDDMEDVADMMAENKSVQSSSRKRKLSTPRKMVQ